MTEANRSTVVVLFNNRNIVSVLPDGTHVIDTGGWRTPRVRHKIEEIIEKLGFTITQQAGIWYVTPLDLNRSDRYVFTDSLSITPKGVVQGAERDTHFPNVTKNLVNQYVADWSKAWEEGVVAPPNPSDPHTFYSCAESKKKPNLAEMRQQMQMYYRNRFFFGSLLMVAINQVGGSKTSRLDLVGKFHLQDWLKNGQLPPSKLLQGSSLALRRIVRMFLYKLHGISGTPARSKA